MATLQLDWLDDFATRWRRQCEQGRRPHALLLLGAPGVGKRCAAAWLAAELLTPDRATPLPGYPAEPPVHPDLHWLTRPEDKTAIGIDQVRALGAELALTSHEGRGKVAVIEPAQLMTIAAANSLLKTLEEPPGDVLLVLVADRLGRLPATIMSRCQRVSVAVPDGATSLAWLDRARPGGRWPEALSEAGGAPLAALVAAEGLDGLATMAADLAAIAARRASPVEVAERWHREDPVGALDWLGRQVQACLRRKLGGSGAQAVVDDSVLSRMDSRNLFCYLDIINRLRAQPSGSYSPLLALESLLVDWAEGLANVRGQDSLAALWRPAHAR